MLKPVLNKKDFVRRYAKGEFGNASPTWNHVDGWGRSEYKGPAHIRNRIAGEQTWYDVPHHLVLDAWIEAVSKYGATCLYISAMCPTEKTLFQGEVQRGLWGLDLYYTTIAKPMREALAAQSQHVHGIMADSLLYEYLCQRSYDWLLHLLDNYPDHVVEFTALSVEWGTVPGHNTIFWEVRKY